MRDASPVIRPVSVLVVDHDHQDPRTKPKALLKLLEAGEKAKKQLSPVGVTDAPINIECLWEDVSQTV